MKVNPACQFRSEEAATLADPACEDAHAEAVE
uniref:Uncharacterized protein n=1 Tax=Physcomitrium patens TaxID=3218 RepID=A0A2K1JRI9_PHYPA|nr:hypothetical protein PHYPA_016537 [Physcomitrium patens]PNR44155.1 hypothetical protein PHYPA_016539 [Physcomitrium patens]